MKINLSRIVILYMLVLSCMKVPSNNPQVTSLVIQTNKQVQKALLDAITQNNTQQVQKLLEDASAEDVKEVLTSCKDGKTPLRQAVEEGKDTLAKILVSKANSLAIVEEVFKQAIAHCDLTLMPFLLKATSIETQVLISGLESAEKRHEMGIIATILENLNAPALSALLLSLVQQDKDSLLPYLFTPENLEKLSMPSIKQAWEQAVSQEKVAIVTVLVEHAQTTLANPTIATALRELPESPCKNQVIAAMPPLEEVEEVKEQLQDVTLSKVAPAPEQTQLAENTPDATLGREAIEEKIEEKKEAGPAISFEPVSKEELQIWEQGISEKELPQIWEQVISQKDDKRRACLLKKLQDQPQIKFIVGKLVQAIKKTDFCLIPRILKNLGKEQVINVLLTADAQKEYDIIPSLLDQAKKANLEEEALAQAIAKEKLDLVGRMLDLWIDQLADGVLQKSFKTTCQQGNSNFVKLFLEKEKVKKQLQDVTPLCFTQAINQDQDTIVGYFLEHAQGSLSEDILGNALVQAIEGEKKAVQTLLAQVSEAVISSCFQQACASGQAEVANALLKRAQLANATIVSGLTQAINQDQCAVVDCFLAQGCVPDATLGTVLVQAIEGEKKAVQTLLAQVSKAVISSCFQQACASGQAEVATALLKRAQLANATIVSGLTQAINQDQCAVVDCFLAQGCVPDATLGTVLVQAIDSCFQQACASGQAKVANALLKRAQLANATIVSGLTQAINQDQDTIVGYFLEHAQGSLSEDILGNALVQAIEGEKKAVQTLLAQVSKAVISSCFQQACASGQAEVANALLKRAQLANATIVSGLTQAINQDQCAVVDCFLAQGCVPDATLGTVLVQAIEGEKKAVQTLLAQVSKAVISSCFQQACASGQAKVANALLKRAQLANATIVSGLTQAINQDQCAVVDCFLAQGCVPDATLGTVLVQAIEGEKKAVQETLLAQVSEAVISSCFQQACGSGQAEVANALLKRAQLANATIVSGLTQAINQDQCAVVDCFLAQGCVPDATLGTVLVQAIEGEKKAVQTLLAQVSEAVISSCFQQACASGQAEVATALLKRAQLANATIVSGLTQAINQDQCAVVDCFLAQGCVPDATLGTVLVQAIEGEKKAVQETLLAQVSEAVISSCFQQACASGQAEVATALLKRAQLANATIVSGLTQAINQDQCAVVDCFLAQGCVPDATLGTVLVQAIDSCFQQACASGQAKVATALLKRAQLANATIVSGLTQAINQDQCAVVDCFLAQGCVPDATLGTVLVQAIEGEKKAV